MTVKLTVEVSEELDQELEHHKDQLPEILQLGLSQLQPNGGVNYQDQKAILDKVFDQSNPQEILELKPSPEFEAHFSNLLERSKEGKSSKQEEDELEQYLELDHLVRLAKIYAARKLSRQK